MIIVCKDVRYAVVLFYFYEKQLVKATIAL